MRDERSETRARGLIWIGAFVAAAVGVSACAATHASDDAAPTPLDVPDDDAAYDAPPPLPDSGECGTLGQPCEDDSDCGPDLMCVRELSVDAGVAGLCLPLPRGSCIGFGGGDECPVETDVCTGSRYVSDSGWCFEPTQFRCMCGWPEFADFYDGCARQ